MTYPQIVESGISIDQTTITVVDVIGSVTFLRSARGGTVVSLRQGRVVFIDDHADYGDFTADKRAWVTAYYDVEGGDEHNGCGCSHDTYYDD